MRPNNVQGVLGGLLTLPSFLHHFPQIDTANPPPGYSEGKASNVQGITVGAYTLGCFVSAKSSRAACHVEFPWSLQHLLISVAVRSCGNHMAWKHARSKAHHIGWEHDHDRWSCHPVQLFQPSSTYRLALDHWLWQWYEHINSAYLAERDEQGASKRADGHD